LRSGADGDQAGSADSIAKTLPGATVAQFTRGERVAMDSYQAFPPQERWTPAEKKAARKAFDQAIARHFLAIAKKARRMLDDTTDPFAVWRTHNYLSERREYVDRIYVYRYSQLLQVFSVLMREGWLKEEDLAGIDPEKVEKIKRGAAVL
jgi:hypothetical protein